MPLVRDTSGHSLYDHVIETGPSSPLPSCTGRAKPGSKHTLLHFPPNPLLVILNLKATPSMEAPWPALRHLRGTNRQALESRRFASQRFKIMVNLLLFLSLPGRLIPPPGNPGWAEHSSPHRVQGGRLPRQDSEPQLEKEICIWRPNCLFPLGRTSLSLPS